jgi:hypothetical protein
MASDLGMDAMGFNSPDLMGTAPHLGVLGINDIPLDQVANALIYHAAPQAALNDIGNAGISSVQGLMNFKTLAKNKWGTKADGQLTAAGMAAMMAGTLGGGILGNALSPYKDGTNYAGTGSSVGGMLGGMAFGPIGGLVGGLLGGLVGGLFGKHQPKVTPEFAALAKIERNTRETVTALDNQTRQLFDLDSRMLNVPATFTVPTLAPFGAGSTGGIAIHPGAITVHVQQSNASAPDIGREVARAVAQELRANGTAYDSRFG